MPTVQARHALALSACETGLCVPAAHCEHCDMPGEAEKLPAAQGKQVMAARDGLNVPAAQDRQVEAAMEGL